MNFVETVNNIGNTKEMSQMLWRRVEVKAGNSDGQRQPGKEAGGAAGRVWRVRVTT